MTCDLRLRDKEPAVQNRGDTALDPGVRDGREEEPAWHDAASGASWAWAEGHVGRGGPEHSRRAGCVSVLCAVEAVGGFPVGMARLRFAFRSSPVGC